MTVPTHINLYGTVGDSIVDGPGLRAAVFVQGCSHHCPGCHNPESQPFEGGELTSLDDLMERIRSNGLVKDVTLSGGEPFEQPEACAELARRLREEGYGLWAYTGYLYEDLLAQAQQEGPRAQAIAQLLGSLDVLVDGPFVQSKKSYMLKWRGSSNQRVIDMKATRAAGRVVLWETKEDFPTKPASW